MKFINWERKGNFKHACTLCSCVNLIRYY